MSEMIVFAFDTPDGALQIIDAVDRLQKQQLLELEDAALVVRAQGGQVNIGQVNRLERSNPQSYGFWNRLMRRAIPTPSTFYVLSDDIFADSPSLIGLDDDFITDVGAAIGPGNSALFLLVPAALPDEAMDALRSYNATVLRAPGLIILDDLAAEEEIYETDEADWAQDEASSEESSDIDTLDKDMTLGVDLPGDPDFPGW